MMYTIIDRKEQDLIAICTTLDKAENLAAEYIEEYEAVSYQAVLAQREYLNNHSDKKCSDSVSEPYRIYIYNEESLAKEEIKPPLIYMETIDNTFIYEPFRKDREAIYRYKHLGYEIVEIEEDVILDCLW